MKNLLGLFALALTGQAALADSRQYIDAVNAYNRGNFGTAITLFKVLVNGKEPRNAAAHYYLANALFHLNNRTAALDEYQKALHLTSDGQLALHCQNAIDHLTGKPTPAPTAALIRPAAGSQTLEAKKETPPLTITGMPRIPTIQQEDEPSLSDVLTWTAAQESSYVQQALVRKNRALERLDEMQEVIKRAKLLGASAVTSTRQYGERDEETRARIESGKSQLVGILKPYEDAVAARQKEVEQANSIYETCLSAQRRISGF